MVVLRMPLRTVGRLPLPFYAIKEMMFEKVRVDYQHKGIIS
jgi:hypothetical protein